MRTCLNCASRLSRSGFAVLSIAAAFTFGRSDAGPPRCASALTLTSRADATTANNSSFMRLILSRKDWRPQRHARPATLSLWRKTDRQLDRSVLGMDAPIGTADDQRRLDPRAIAHAVGQVRRAHHREQRDQRR